MATFTYDGQTSQSITFDPAEDTLTLNLTTADIRDVNEDEDGVRIFTQSGAVLTLAGVTYADLADENSIVFQDGGAFLFADNDSNGTAVSDVLVGDDDANDLVAAGGNNLIFGGGGVGAPDDAADNITASNGNDTIYGNGGDDVIASTGGSDLVYGGIGGDDISVNPQAGETATVIGGGNVGDPLDEGDTITVGTVDGSDLAISAGNALVFGNGGGDDITVSANGDNTVYGGFGNDTVSVNGNGDNLIVGGLDDEDSITVVGDGNNTVFGAGSADGANDLGDIISVTGDGDNQLFGNGGDDEITVVGDGDNSVYGGLGEDTISVGAAAAGSAASGDNLIIGGTGTNTINVISEGNTTVIGGSSEGDAADLVTTVGLTLSGDGETVVYANAGDDTVTGTLADDASVTVFGGLDDDTVGLSVAEDATAVVYGQTGEDTITLTGDGDVTVYGGSDAGDTEDGDDTISTGDGDNLVYGNAGDDGITVGGGDNTVFGGIGDDTISAGAGDNLLYGQDGDDSITAGDGDNTIYGGNGAGDTVDGDDNITSGAGDDLIYGNAGDDTVSAGGGENTVFGGFGDDSILGGAATDVLYGQAGDDTINGAAGDDIIISGGDNDTLTGGDGEDLILINDGGGAQAETGNTPGDKLITGDYAVGTDRVFVNGGTTASNYVALAGEGEADGDLIIRTGVRDIVFQDGADELTVVEFNNTVTTDSVAAGTAPASSSILVSNIGDDAGSDINDGLEAAGEFDTDGDDRFFLGTGGDTVDAGAGNDTIYSGEGADELTGGEGDDVFSFEVGESGTTSTTVDFITDFDDDDSISFGDDTIAADDFEDVGVVDGANLAAAATNAFVAGDEEAAVSFNYNETSYLAFDADGDGAFDGENDLLVRTSGLGESVDGFQDGVITILGSDEEYTTFDAALAAAEDGDTLQVGAGTYGRFTLDKSVNIVGEDGAIVDGSGTTGQPTILLADGADGGSISGLTVIASDNSGAFQTTSYQSDPTVSIDGFTLSNNTFDTGDATSGQLVYLNPGATNFTISDNELLTGEGYTGTVLSIEGDIVGGSGNFVEANDDPFRSVEFYNGRDGGTDDITLTGTGPGFATGEFFNESTAI